MLGFLAGAITGYLIGVVSTILVLLLVWATLAAISGADTQNAERAAAKQFSNRTVFLTGLVVLVICGACYSLNLQESAMLASLLSVLLIARMAGSGRGLAAAGIAALILAWFLPPSSSLRVTGLDNQLALALFILGTIAGSLLTKGNHSIDRWIPTTDYRC
jgi:K+-sensing histidine kinase KdpD